MCIATVTLVTDAVPVDIILSGGALMYPSSHGWAYLDVLMDGHYLPGYAPQGAMGHLFHAGNLDAYPHFPVSVYHRTRSSIGAGSHSFCLMFGQPGATPWSKRPRAA